MQLLTLIAANALLLLLIIIGVTLDRRLTRLEFAQAALEKLTGEVAELKARMDSAPAPGDAEDTTESDKWRALENEKRFTEGVANILSYDMQAAENRMREAAGGGIL